MEAFGLLFVLAGVAVAIYSGLSLLYLLGAIIERIEGRCPNCGRYHQECD